MAPCPRQSPKTSSQELSRGVGASPGPPPHPCLGMTHSRWGSKVVAGAGSDPSQHPGPAPSGLLPSSLLWDHRAHPPAVPAGHRACRVGRKEDPGLTPGPQGLEKQSRAGILSPDSRRKLRVSWPHPHLPSLCPAPLLPGSPAPWHEVGQTGPVVLRPPHAWKPGTARAVGPAFLPREPCSPGGQEGQ